MIMKHPFPINEFHQLHHFAIPAECDLQIEKVFILKLLWYKEIIGYGHLSKGNERLDR